jgi:hypothetical protein
MVHMYGKYVMMQINRPWYVQFGFSRWNRSWTIAALVWVSFDTEKILNENNVAFIYDFISIIHKNQTGPSSAAKEYYNAASYQSIFIVR